MEGSLKTLVHWAARVQQVCGQAGPAKAERKIRLSGDKLLLEQYSFETPDICNLFDQIDAAVCHKARQLAQNAVLQLRNTLTSAYWTALHDLISLEPFGGPSDEDTEHYVACTFQREWTRSFLVLQSRFEHQLRGIIEQTISDAPRNDFTSRAVCVLEAAFQRKDSLLPAEAVALAQRASLTQQQVRTWFQNRRNRARKAQGQTQALSRTSNNGSNVSQGSDSESEDWDDEYAPSSTTASGRTIARMPVRRGVRPAPRQRPAYPPGHNAYSDNTTKDTKGGRRIKAIPKRAHPPLGHSASVPTSSPFKPVRTSRLNAPNPAGGEVQGPSALQGAYDPSNPFQYTSAPLGRTSSQHSEASEISSVDSSGGFQHPLLPPAQKPTEVMLSDSPLEGTAGPGDTHIVPFGAGSDAFGAMIGFGGDGLEADPSFLGFPGYILDCFNNHAVPTQASTQVYRDGVSGTRTIVPSFGAAEAMAMTAMGELNLDTTSALDVSPHVTSSVLASGPPTTAPSTIFDVTPADPLPFADFGFGSLLDDTSLEWLTDLRPRDLAFADMQPAPDLCAELNTALEVEDHWMNFLTLDTEPDAAEQSAGSIEEISMEEVSGSARSLTPLMTTAAAESVQLARSTEEIFRRVPSTTPTRQPSPSGSALCTPVGQEGTCSPVEPVSAFSAVSAVSTGSTRSAGSNDSAMAALLNLQHYGSPTDEAGSRVPSWGSAISAASTRIITPPSGSYHPATSTSMDHFVPHQSAQSSLVGAPGSSAEMAGVIDTYFPLVQDYAPIPQIHQQQQEQVSWLPQVQYPPGHPLTPSADLQQYAFDLHHAPPSFAQSHAHGQALAHAQYPADDVRSQHHAQGAGISGWIGGALPFERD